MTKINSVSNIDCRKQQLTSKTAFTSLQSQPDSALLHAATGHCLRKSGLFSDSDGYLPGKDNHPFLWFPNS